MPKHTLPDEPDWFAARVRTPSPWDEIEISPEYAAAALEEWRSTATLGEDDPQLPERQRVWRTLPRALRLDAATWTAMDGHGLIGWIHDGLAIARRLQRLTAELGLLDTGGAEYLVAVALYDGGGPTDEGARKTVTEFWYSWTLSPRAFREYERRCEASTTAGPIRQALWLLAPEPSPTRDAVAQQLMLRLGDELDTTGLGSLFLALDKASDTHRAYHLLALACDGRWPVALGDAQRGFYRGEAWLPKHALPEWLGQTALPAPAPGEAGHPAFPDIPPELPTEEELVAGLPASQRQMLAALRAHDYNISEAARALGKTPQAAWQQLERIRAHLRRALGLDD